MGKQLDMFPDDPDANRELDEALAQARLQAAARDATRPRYRAVHRRSRVVSCPSCGTCVRVELS
jgi:ferredoxin